MTDVREVEAKFEIDAASIQRLETVNAVGRFKVVSRLSVSQNDLYFDTPSQELAQSRSSLRIRFKPDRAEMTFKGRREAVATDSEAYIASRLEDEIPLATEVAVRISGGVWLPDDDRLSPMARAREVTKSESLAPTARMHNERTVVRLADDDGQELEMAIDACQGTRLSDGRTISFNELEVEAKSASRDALIDVAAELRAMLPGVRPSHRTKLERVLT